MIKLFLSVARIVLATIVAVMFTSCRIDANAVSGSGKVVTQNRAITEDFHSVSAEGGLDIVIEQNPEKAVIVEADDNIHPHIKTSVENGVLMISSDKNQFINVKSKRVTVKMPMIKSLEASAGVTMTTSKMINTGKLNVSSGSGSSMKIEVEADEIISETSSGSQNTLIGKALNLDISSSSGSENDAGRLLANDVRAQASSGSSITVSPLVSLEGDASSGASIGYRGSPKKIIKDESSGGSVSAE